ncbi:hypothetical protein Tco_0717197 [Tanacetum coccineum]
MVGQYLQKKEEEKQIAEDQAAKDRYWKIPICYDDDDDEESSIHLKDIIISGLLSCVAITPALLTKEPVDSLIMEDEHLDTIPGNRNLGTLSNKVLDMSRTFVPSPNTLEIVRHFNDVILLSDDVAPTDGYRLCRCFTSDYEICQLEVVWRIVYPGKENSSGSTTTRSDYSLPDYEAFYNDHIEQKSSGSTTTYSEFSLSKYVSFIFESLLAYVVWIFLPFLTYPVTPPYLLSYGNEDTILTSASPFIILLCRMYLIRMELS